MIPYSKQNINSEDIKAVTSVLKSDFLTQGPITPKFEKAISKYTGAKYAIAVVNATSALHLACKALDVKKGDLVWTSPISFVASINCALYCNAEIDFVDIEINDFNLSVEKLREKLIKSANKKKLPKVLIVTHLAGYSCKMKEIFELSKLYGFKIIEDASHAIGGNYYNQKIGNCQYSDFTIFSFHPVKIITTCEGGVCLTNNIQLAKKVFSLRSHGIVREDFLSKENFEGSWYYEQIDLGFNYRLNDLQSALGINQLKRIDSLVKERNKIASEYRLLLGEVEDIKFPNYDKDIYSSYHLNIIRVNKEKRKNIFEKLRSEGVFVNVHYIPIYRHPYFKKFNFNLNNFPSSEEYYRTAISIPNYPGLKKTEIKKTCKTIQNYNIGYQNIF